MRHLGSILEKKTKKKNVNRLYHTKKNFKDVIIIHFVVSNFQAYSWERKKKNCLVEKDFFANSTTFDKVAFKPLATKDKRSTLRHKFCWEKRFKARSILLKRIQLISKKKCLSEVLLRMKCSATFISVFWKYSTASSSTKQQMLIY